MYISTSARYDREIIKLRIFHMTKINNICRIKLNNVPKCKFGCIVKSYYYQWIERVFVLAAFLTLLHKILHTLFFTFKNSFKCLAIHFFVFSIANSNNLSHFNRPIYNFINDITSVLDYFNATLVTLFK